MICFSAIVPHPTINSLRTGTMPYLFLYPWCLAHSWDSVNVYWTMFIWKVIRAFLLGDPIVWRFWSSFVTGYVIQELLDCIRGCDVRRDGWRARWRWREAFSLQGWVDMCMCVETSWLFIHKCQSVCLSIRIKPNRANCHIAFWQRRELSPKKLFQTYKNNSNYSWSPCHL